MNRPAHTVKVLSIITLILSAFCIVGCLMGAILSVGLSVEIESESELTATIDNTVANALDEVNGEISDELGDIYDKDGNPIGTWGSLFVNDDVKGSDYVVFGLVALIAILGGLAICSAITLVASIIGIRREKRPEKMSTAMVWAIIAAILCFCTARIVSMILYIITAVQAGKAKNLYYSPFSPQPPFMPGQPPYNGGAPVPPAQGYQPFSGNQPYSNQPYSTGQIYPPAQPCAAPYQPQPYQAPYAVQPQVSAPQADQSAESSDPYAPRS